MYFMDIEETFDRAPRNVLEWAVRKKGIEKNLVRSVMSLYEEAKTTVRVDSQLTEEFEVKVRIHQESALSPFFHLWLMLSLN